MLIVVTGIVLSSAPLKPIQWSQWAGEAEREEARRRIGKGRKVDIAQGEVPGGNPFAWLTEDRIGFWDGRVSYYSCLVYDGYLICREYDVLIKDGVQGKRKDFADWVREGGRS